MSYLVSNGAVGKSPMIEKINQLPMGQMKTMSSAQMEQLVCKKKMKYDPVAISFGNCQKELKKQLGR